MKTKNEYPKESTNKHIALGENNESNDPIKEEEENNETNDYGQYEDQDSSHYSVGGDNGW